MFILCIGDGASRLDLFKAMYFVLLGDFDDLKTIYSTNSNYPNLIWFILVLTTIIMTIMMMNLLIAIISEIYTKVKEVEDSAFIYEKTLIISEIDKQYSAREDTSATYFKDEDYLLLAKGSQMMEIPNGRGGAHPQEKLSRGKTESDGDDNLSKRVKLLESKLESLEKNLKSTESLKQSGLNRKFNDKREDTFRETVKNFLDKMAVAASDDLPGDTSPRMKVFQHLDKDKDGVIASMDIERALVEANSEFRPDELYKIMANFRAQGKQKYNRDDFYEWCRSSVDEPAPFTKFNTTNIFKKML